MHGWRGYDVVFPNLTRDVDATYYSITSERFDAVLRAKLPARAIMTGRRVLALSATAVVLGDGDRIEAGGVIDCRGPATSIRWSLAGRSSSATNWRCRRRTASSGRG